MRNRLEELEQRRKELLACLHVCTELERVGYVNPKRRLRYASKLAHVDAAILKLRQGRLFT